MAEHENIIDQTWEAYPSHVGGLERWLVQDCHDYHILTSVWVDNTEAIAKMMAAAPRLAKVARQLLQVIHTPGVLQDTLVKELRNALKLAGVVEEV